jgi:hypothetical protein
MKVLFAIGRGLRDLGLLVSVIVGCLAVGLFVILPKKIGQFLWIKCRLEQTINALAILGAVSLIYFELWRRREWNVR